MQDGEYSEIIRIIVDVDENNKPRFRSVCRVANDSDLFYIKASLLDALDMPLHIEDEDKNSKNSM
jgi:hypothetical protein